MRIFTLRKKGRDPSTLASLANVEKKAACSVNVDSLDTCIRVLEDWVHNEHGHRTGCPGYYDEPGDYEEMKLARQLRRQVEKAKRKFEAKK